MNKKTVIALIVAAVILIGGGVAYAFLNQSPKQAYALAEKSNMEKWNELFTARYQSEFDWYEKMQQGKYTLSSDISFDVAENENDLFGLTAMLNSLVIKAETAYDAKAMQAEINIKPTMMDAPMGDFHIGIKEHDLTLASDATGGWSIDDKTLTTYMQSQTAESTAIDFTKLFSTNSTQQKEDASYLTTHYSKLFFDTVSADSFVAKKGTTAVYGNDVKANNIIMTLKEEEVRKVLEVMLEELATDKKTKEIIESNTAEAATFYDDLEKMKKEVATMDVPAITSSIWESKGIIVSRELTLTNANDTSYVIAGVRDITKNNSSFKYTFTTPQQDESTVIGELIFDGTKISDSVTLTTAESEIVYEANEDDKDGNRIFERKVVLTDKLQDNAGTTSIAWSGDTTRDAKKSDDTHVFTLDIDGENLGKATVANTTTLDGKSEPYKVNVPVTDLTSMTPAQIDEQLSSFIEALFGTMAIE